VTVASRARRALEGCRVWAWVFGCLVALGLLGGLLALLLADLADVSTIST
jgi:hypothetical protein